MGALALGSLLSLLGCGILRSEAHPPSGLEERLSLSDPLHPPFEAKLRQEGSLFDSLLLVDQFIYSQIDAGAARAAFERLSLETSRTLKLKRTGAEAPVTPEEAATAFLATLKSQGYVYGLTPSGSGEPDSKVFSYTLVQKMGCCGTFSLLCMAYLDRVGIGSSIVCLPDHCFVRVMSRHHSTDIESTDFDAPGRGDSGVEVSLHSNDASSHYGRSLSHKETLWHYYVDRLWTWNAWRSTDDFALRALEQARSVLGSTCLSIEAQEAQRYFAIVRNPDAPENRRDLAWRQSYGRFCRLNQILPGQEDFQKAIAELERMPQGSQRAKEYRELLASLGASAK